MLNIKSHKNKNIKQRIFTERTADDCFYYIFFFKFYITACNELRHERQTFFPKKESRSREKKKGLIEKYQKLHEK